MAFTLISYSAYCAVVSVLYEYIAIVFPAEISNMIMPPAQAVLYVKMDMDILKRAQCSIVSQAEREHVYSAKSI